MTNVEDLAEKWQHYSHNNDYLNKELEEVFKTLFNQITTRYHYQQKTRALKPLQDIITALQHLLQETQNKTTAISDYQQWQEKWQIAIQELTSAKPEVKEWKEYTKITAEYEKLIQQFSLNITQTNVKKEKETQKQIQDKINTFAERSQKLLAEISEIALAKTTKENSKILNSINHFLKDWDEITKELQTKKINPQNLTHYPKIEQQITEIKTLKKKMVERNSLFSGRKSKPKRKNLYCFGRARKS